MDIDFFTFIGPNSADYADYLKYTCDIFLSGKHNINWKCIESVGSERLPQGYTCVAKAGNTGHNSMNHGVALNLALDYIESEYVVFVDADMAVVHQNWDDILVKELNRNDCFGVGYNDKIKYKNFPTVYFFGFRSYVSEKVKLDFTPDVKPGVDKPVRRIITKTEAKMFGLKAGSIIKCDTGWKLPLIVRGDGFNKIKTMPMIMMTSKNAQLPFENKQHKQLCMKKPAHMYEWHYNDKVFTTHKQASRTQPIDGTWGDAWKRRIDLYIKGKR